MSKRDNGVPRRLRWAGVLAAVLVLGTGTAAAQAFWSARVDLRAGPVASGSLAVSTQWVGDWSKWTPLFPGASSETATLRVTETGAGGTTLRWRATPVVALSPELAPYVSTQVFVGSCGSATIIAAGAPITTPTPTAVNACRSTSRWMLPELAPMAIRMPISRVRCEAHCETTPERPRQTSSAAARPNAVASVARSRSPRM